MCHATFPCNCWASWQHSYRNRFTNLFLFSQLSSSSQLLERVVETSKVMQRMHCWGAWIKMMSRNKKNMTTTERRERQPNDCDSQIKHNEERQMHNQSSKKVFSDFSASVCTPDLFHRLHLRLVRVRFEQPKTLSSHPDSKSDNMIV